MLSNQKKSFIFGFILLPTILFINACSSSEQTEIKPQKTPTKAKTPEKKNEAKTVEITIEKYAFSPKILKIEPGTKVIWINKDKVSHTVTSDQQNFDSGLFGEGKEFFFVFEKAGAYGYFCIPHPNMKAEIIVEYKKGEN
jgi:plastocyanin